MKLTKIFSVTQSWRFAFAIVFGIIGCTTSQAPPAGSVIMRILNHAGAPIELFWINVFDPQRPLLKQTAKPIRNNTDNVVRFLFRISMLDEVRVISITFNLLLDNILFLDK